jgi:hypothetical protein
MPTKIILFPNFLLITSSKDTVTSHKEVTNQLISRFFLLVDGRIIITDPDLYPEGPKTNGSGILQQATHFSFLIAVCSELLALKTDPDSLALMQIYSKSLYPIA